MKHTTDWIIESPLDMHLHLRQGDVLSVVTPCSSRLFAGAVIMPNLVPPVTSLARLLSYRQEVAQASGRDTFDPYMTLFFRDYTRRELEEADQHIIGVKLYPEGITTNSDGGVRDWTDYRQVLADMQDLGIPLLVHGESHGFVLDREREFLAEYRKMAREFPRLMIVMEHITTREAIALLEEYENLHATITVHHLLLTLDDMAGGLLNPHLFCKPLLKRPEDRAALQQAVLDGHPRIFFGSDSAPHPVDRKECCGCAAGVFSAPVALSLLAEFFDRHQRRPAFQSFISDNAVQAYRLAPPAKRIALYQEPWTVPGRIGTVIPLMAGETLAWSARVVE